MEALFLIGRLLLGGYFVYNAYNHFTAAEALTGYAASKKVPHPKIAVFMTGVMMLIGGLSVLTGIGIVIGLALLVVFLVGVSLVMHPFWKVNDPLHQMTERINFTKNVALVGALMMIMALAMY